MLSTSFVMKLLLLLFLCGTIEADKAAKWDDLQMALYGIESAFTLSRLAQLAVYETIPEDKMDDPRGLLARLVTMYSSKFESAYEALQKGVAAKTLTMDQAKKHLDDITMNTKMIPKHGENLLLEFTEIDGISYINSFVQALYLMEQVEIPKVLHILKQIK